MNPTDGSAAGVYTVDALDISLDAGLEAIALSPDGTKAPAFDFISGVPDQHLIMKVANEECDVD